MPLLTNVVADAVVHDGLVRIEALIADELARGDEVVRDAALIGLQTGSIRLRPLFTMLAAQFGPTPDAWQVTVAGAATELIYLATLCHDDVIEHAEVRRGAARMCTRSANNSAILAGDYQFATASRLGSRLGQQGFQVIAEAFAELVTGKMRETLGVAPDADPIEHHLRCAAEKSGSLLAAAGQLGSTFSGANDELRVALSLLGRLVGTAAQISHDVVDIRGALRRGVRTLPVHFALRDPGADRLRSLLAAPVDEDNVAEAVALVRSSPGIAQARELLTDYAERAGDELASLPDCAGRQALSTLIEGLIAAEN